MKNIINIGIPSKGRLRKDVLKIFSKRKLKLISERGERDLIGSIQKKTNIKILYLHAREIIERLGDGSLDVGFSGFDLFKESEINIQNKISVVKKLNFGNANLVLAIPPPRPPSVKAGLIIAGNPIFLNTFDAWLLLLMISDFGRSKPIFIIFFHSFQYLFFATNSVL